MQVSEAHAHVMDPGVGNTNGEAQSQQALSDAQHIEIVISAEQRAGYRAPEKSGDRQGQIGQVCHGKKQRSHTDGRIARHDTRQTGHEIVLQEELLIERPQDVPTDVPQIGLKKAVKCPQVLCQESTEDREYDRRRQDPERGHQPAKTKPEVVQAGTADQNQHQRCQQRDRPKNQLLMCRQPQDG